MEANKFFDSLEEEKEYLEAEKEIADVKENKNESIWSIIKLIGKSLLPNSNG